MSQPLFPQLSALLTETLLMKILKQNAADAIRNFQSLPHRLEVVARKDGVTYVNDSQSTIPDASIAALKSFPATRHFVVGWQGQNRGRFLSRFDGCGAAKRRQNRSYLARRQQMLQEVARAQSVKDLQINRCNTLAEALESAKIEASPGETIVLSPACASFDQFKSYEDRGQTFRRLVDAL